MLAVPDCTAFAVVRGEDRCLVGSFEGSLISVSLPDGKPTRIHKFDHTIETIAFDPVTSTTAVITFDEPSFARAIFLLRSDRTLTKIEVPFVQSGLHFTHLQWSPKGQYLAVIYDSAGQSDTDWLIIDAESGRILHREADSGLATGAPNFHDGECRCIAFTPTNAFFALVKKGERISAIGYFEIRRDDDGGELNCKLIDIESFPGSISTLFGVGEGHVSALVRKVYRTGQQICTIYHLHEVKGRLVSDKAAVMPVVSGDRTPVSTWDGRDPLFTISREIVPNVMVRAPVNLVLEGFHNGQIKRLWRSTHPNIGYPVLRIDRPETVAAFYGEGIERYLTFVDLAEDSFTFNRRTRYDTAGDFCGVDSRFFVAVDVYVSDIKRMGERPMGMTLRVWDFPSVDEGAGTAYGSDRND